MRSDCKSDRADFILYGSYFQFIFSTPLPKLSFSSYLIIHYFNDSNGKYPKVPITLSTNRTRFKE